VLAFGGGGQAKLYGRGKVFHDTPPVAFIVGTATVTLINDDAVKEVRRIKPKFRIY
jgi:nitrogenase molybdenum-iron protein alpha/beta subunit